MIPRSTRARATVVLIASLWALAPVASQAGNNVSLQLSTQPPGIVLVGQAGQPDPIGRVTYVMIDIQGAPLAFRHVTISFAGCRDLVICSDQVAPGVTIDCTAKTAVALTDLEGRVSFTVVGRGVAGSARDFGACAVADLEGHQLYDLRVSTYDLDGVNGINAGDLVIWGADFASGMARTRSDYNFDGIVGAADLAIWGKAFSGGGSALSGTSSCGP